MHRSLLIPLIILGFYGIEGFSDKIDKLFYFKIIIITILYLILSNELVENYATERSEECSCRKGTYPITEVPGIKNDQDCIEKKHCVNDDRRSAVSCYYKCSPKATKSDNKIRRREQNVYKEIDRIKKACSKCNVKDESYCNQEKYDVKSVCNYCDRLESKKDCDSNLFKYKLDKNSIKNCKEMCFATNKTKACGTVPIGPQNKLKRRCYECHFIKENNMCEKFKDKKDIENCKKVCYPSESYFTMYNVFVYVIIPAAIFFIVKNRTFSNLMEKYESGEYVPESEIGQQVYQEIVAGESMSESMSVDTQPVAEPMPQPAAEPMAQPVAEPMPQPVAEPMAQPVAEPMPQPAAEPMAQPLDEPMAQPVAEPMAQPVAEPMPQPVAEPMPQPVAESMAQPVAEPMPQPVVESMQKAGPQTNQQSI